MLPAFRPCEVISERGYNGNGVEMPSLGVMVKGCSP